MEQSADDNIDLDELYAFAVQLGKDAGKLLLDAADRRCEASQASNQAEAEQHVQKENAVDLVTQTDEGMVKCDVNLCCFVGIIAKGQKKMYQHLYILQAS